MTFEEIAAHHRCMAEFHREMARRDPNPHSFHRAELDFHKAVAARLEQMAQERAWHRLPDELPPQDGTAFELRFDDSPTRYFAAWLRRERSSGRYGDDFSCAVLRMVGDDQNIPWWGLISLQADQIAEMTGWWRPLALDDPPGGKDSDG